MWPLDMTPTPFRKEISSLAQTLARVLPLLQAVESHQASAAAVQQLLDTLDDESDLPSAPWGHVSALTRQLQPRSQRSWQKALAHQKKRRLHAEAAVQDELANKISGRINNVWHCRVGLADPSIDARTLANLCREFCN